MNPAHLDGQLERLMEVVDQQILDFRATGEHVFYSAPDGFRKGTLLGIQFGLERLQIVRDAIAEAAIQHAPECILAEPQPQPEQAKPTSVPCFFPNDDVTG